MKLAKVELIFKSIPPFSFQILLNLENRVNSKLIYIILSKQLKIGMFYIINAYDHY